MALTTKRELFVHELADAMSSENIILGMLPELQKESINEDIRSALKNHEEETKQHVKNLKAVFKLLGEKPEQTTCHGTEGLKKEHAALHEEDPSPEILQMGVLSGASKTEHYEIANYEGLVLMAKDLGETEVAKLLQENLDQEIAMEKLVAKLAKQVTKELTAVAAD